MAQKQPSKSAKFIEELREKEEKRITCTLSLDKNSYEKLKRFADDADLKISHIVDKLIQDFLSEIVKK